MVIDLDSVATRRASWLWLMIVSTLVVAGCSTGQAAPSGSLVRLSLTNAAATGTGTLTGDVCKPLQAPPQAKVTVSLRESVPGVGWGPQIRSETVPQNAKYRFRSVLAGIYVLVGQWPASPLFTASAWVSAHQTSVVNLGSCIPTTGVDYKPASAAFVRQFVAEATAGGDRAFSATYRYLGGEIYGDQPTGQTFFFAQRPHGGERSMYPWGAGDFAYRAHLGDKSLEFIQRLRHDYECVRNRPGAPWSCEGPNYETIGNTYAVLTYDELAGILNDMPPPPKSASTTSGILNGLKVTCLRYRQSDGSLATWCITSDGITAFAATSNGGNVEMLKLSASIPAHSFSLPASPVKWQGYVAVAHLATRRWLRAGVCAVAHLATRRWLRLYAPSLSATVLIFMGALAIAGCTTGQTTPTTSSATTTSSTTTQPPTTTHPVSTAAPRPCRSDQLAAHAQQGSGAVGQEGILVVFRNAGETTCKMRGYPTAWVVNYSHVRVGPVSDHEGSIPVTTVLLSPGALANTVIAIANPAFFQTPSDCQPTAAEDLRVFPPGQATSLLLPFPNGIVVCSINAPVGASAISSGDIQESM